MTDTDAPELCFIGTGARQGGTDKNGQGGSAIAKGMKMGREADPTTSRPPGKQVGQGEPNDTLAKSVGVFRWVLQ